MKIDISIVIVNYNVKAFLEQCLMAIERAKHNLNIEIFVVDNASVDGSQAMVKKKFPSVNLIENHRNLGFARANNQALRLVKGEYILILNPAPPLSPAAAGIPGGASGRFRPVWPY